MSGSPCHPLGIFGFCTFIVSTLSYWGVNKLASLIVPAPETYDTWVLFSVGRLQFKWIYAANAVSWVCAVAFAFFTNKLFVFESRSFAPKVFWRELGTFVSARILSFILFEELTFAALELLFRSFGWNAPDWIAKILIAVFVVVFNYVASKLVIFRKGKQPAEAPEAPPEDPPADAPGEGSENE